jgi:hypothetical protein
MLDRMSDSNAGRRGALTVLAASLAILGGLLIARPAPSHASSPPCGPAGAHTLAVDGVARVYALGSSVFGCANGGSRSYKLGQRKTCVGAARVGPVVVSARLAAYALSRCGVDTGFTQVIVERLTDGVQLRALAATSPPGPESFQSVGSLALKSDGAVAWIGTGSSIVGDRKLIEVRKADRDGVKLLDSGGAIDVASLRLHHSRLSWKHGSATRTATLH